MPLLLSALLANASMVQFTLPEGAIRLVGNAPGEGLLHTFHGGTVRPRLYHASGRSALPTL